MSQPIKLNFEANVKGLSISKECYRNKHRIIIRSEDGKSGCTSYEEQACYHVALSWDARYLIGVNSSGYIMTWLVDAILKGSGSWSTPVHGDALGIQLTNPVYWIAPMSNFGKIHAGYQLLGEDVAVTFEGRKCINKQSFPPASQSKVSPDGKILATVHDERTVIRLWSLDDLRSIRQILYKKKLPRRKKGAVPIVPQVGNIFFSPNGLILAVVYETDLVLFNCKSGKKVMCIEGQCKGDAEVAFAENASMIGIKKEEIVHLWSLPK